MSSPFLQVFTPFWSPLSCCGGGEGEPVLGCTFSLLLPDLSGGCIVSTVPLGKEEAGRGSRGRFIVSFGHDTMHTVCVPGVSCSSCHGGQWWTEVVVKGGHTS